MTEDIRLVSWVSLLACRQLVCCRLCLHVIPSEVEGSLLLLLPGDEISRLRCAPLEMTEGVGLLEMTEGVGRAWDDGGGRTARDGGGN